MNKFNWIKKGILLNDAPKKEWAQSHFQFSAVLERSDAVRIFYTTRPLPDNVGKYVTYIRSVDVEKDNLKSIIKFSEEPIIKLGKKGSFDEFGTMPGDFLFINNDIYLYYTGWQRLSSVPYTFSVGLAVSKDHGETFIKYSDGPIIGQTPDTPLTVGSGTVYEEDALYHQFCIVGIEWITIKGKLEHTYCIKHATSVDGINWKFIEEPAIKMQNQEEALAAPTIIKIEDTYHMWFSYRGSNDFRGGEDSYKIGYAFSKDLYKWERNDEMSGISASESGWDSEMICYPFVKKIEGKYIMFYNGNSFGKEGLGYAELEIL